MTTHDVGSFDARLLSSLKSRSVVANLASVGDEVNGVARVVVACAFDDVVKPDASEFVAAANTALKGAAQVIPGTFHEVPSKGQRSFVGMVKANAQTRHVSAAEISSYRVLSGNLLVDADDDSLWKVKSDVAGGKILERQEADAMKEMLEVARVKTLIRPTKVQDAQIAAAEQDYVRFIDPVSHDIRHGVVVSVNDDSIDVLPTEDTDETIRLDENLVVASVEMDEEVKDTRRCPSRAALSAYYAKMYRHQPDYFKRLEAIINKDVAF